MGKKVSDYYFHGHPLIFIENVSDMEPTDCYGCGEAVTNLEAAYVCEESCSNRVIFHKKCGELPDEICHPKHLQHPLLLRDYHESILIWCGICLRYFYSLGYQCTSCNFMIDLNCAKLVVMEKQLPHPSHPDHPLTLIRKPAFKFCCDGCGDEKVDMAYICSNTCECWIHKTCASLPLVLPTNRHHHPVSLLFSFPAKLHLKYEIFDCDVCLKRLNKTCWVYSCGDCSFFAHLKCVTSRSETTERVSNVEEDDNDGGFDVIEFPLHPHDISVKLITPFVKRENKIIPDLENVPRTSAPYSFLFNYHKHPLTLASEFSDDAEQVMDEEEGSNAAEDKFKICNVCVTPISSPPYYECNACKFFVHSICYFLPKTISSSSSLDFYRLHGYCPVTQNENHKFTLRTSPEYEELYEEMHECMHCSCLTNGIVYECEGCKMKMDVKCACLPPAIRHASHPHHKPLTITRIPQGSKKKMYANCCMDFTDTAYCCSSEDCDFAFHWRCVMLPASVMMLEWDKHPLLLTFDASFDHPSSFICGFCEADIHPKAWMYHCRQCDNSFHLLCLKAASGPYRNIKFGRRFVFEGIHPHPLTFNCVTIKRRCDICRGDEYNYCGLECALCNYLMCLRCAREKASLSSSSK